MASGTMTFDGQALRSAAEKVSSSASELANQMNSFSSVIEGLNKTWSSDVKTKFFTSYEKDLKALQEMVSQYSEVADGIRSIADEKEKAEEDLAKNEKKISTKTLLIQGVATSIDALSVGFAIADYSALKAFICGLIIAVVTFFICMLGVKLGKLFGCKLHRYANFLGGGILIAIGLEIFIKSFI